jgi:hypothetical protein
MPHLSRLVKAQRNHADFQFPSNKNGRSLKLRPASEFDLPLRREKTLPHGFCYNGPSPCPASQIKFQTNPHYRNPAPGLESRPSAAHAFWQILTLFESTKLSTHRAFRNAFGVVLPLIAGFTRGLLRIAGTIVGLVLATELFHLLNPGVILQVILIFVFVFLMRWLGPANYGIFGIAVSALIVLLFAIAAVPPKDVIWARGINTVAGGLLALLAYWLWPTGEHTRVSERIVGVLDAYRSYAHALSRCNTADESSMQELERARRGARIARASLETSIDRLRAEPGTTPERLARFQCRAGQLSPFHSCSHGAGCNFFSPASAFQLFTYEKLYSQVRDNSNVARRYSSWRRGGV